VLINAPSADTTSASNEISDNFQFGLVVQHPTAGIPPFADNVYTDDFFGSTPSLVPGSRRFQSRRLISRRRGG